MAVLLGELLSPAARNAFFIPSTKSVSPASIFSDITQSLGEQPPLPRLVRSHSAGEVGMRWVHMPPAPTPNPGMLALRRSYSPSIPSPTASPVLSPSDSPTNCLQRNPDPRQTEGDELASLLHILPEPKAKNLHDLERLLKKIEIFPKQIHIINVLLKAVENADAFNRILNFFSVLVIPEIDYVTNDTDLFEELEPTVAEVTVIASLHAIVNNSTYKLLIKRKLDSFHQSKKIFVLKQIAKYPDDAHLQLMIVKSIELLDFNPIDVAVCSKLFGCYGRVSIERRSAILDSLVSIKNHLGDVVEAIAKL